MLALVGNMLALVVNMNMLALVREESVALASQTVRLFNEHIIVDS